MCNAVPGLPGLLAIFFDIGNRKPARLLSLHFTSPFTSLPRTRRRALRRGPWPLASLRHLRGARALERYRAPPRRHWREARDPQRCLGLLPRLDGARIELIADSLGQMYGYEVL